MKRAHSTALDHVRGRLQRGDPGGLVELEHGGRELAASSWPATDTASPAARAPAAILGGRTGRCGGYRPGWDVGHRMEQAAMDDFTVVPGTELPATMRSEKPGPVYPPLTDRQREELAAILQTIDVVWRKPEA